MAALLHPALSKRSSSIGSSAKGEAQEVPTPEWVQGTQRYTFDNRTAAGKKAITDFVHESVEVRQLIEKNVPAPARAKVAQMASFDQDQASGA